MSLRYSQQMLRLYYRAHQQADKGGGHSTEENLLTIHDLKWVVEDGWMMLDDNG